MRVIEVDGYVLAEEQYAKPLIILDEIGARRGEAK